MVFDESWFVRHQSKLLLALNFGGIGHALRKALGLPLSGSVRWIAPHAVGLGRPGGKILARFYTDDHFAKLLHAELLPVWRAFHAFDLSIANKLQPAWNLGFDTLTQYPDAGSGSTDTVDGEIVSYDSGSSWAAARDGSNLIAYETNTDITVECSWDGFSTYTISRAYLSFKTGLLGTGATIISASLNVRGSDKSMDTGYTVDVVSWSGTDNNDVATGDWGNVGSTSYGYLFGSALSTSAYNAFTINGTGQAQISKTLITRYALRMSPDISDSPPSGTNYFSFRAADNGTDKPYLEVVYTPETPGSPYSVTYNSSGAWVAPVNVSSVDAEVRGPGGNGSTMTSNGGGGGGGGGAYSKGSVSVTAGNLYSFVVGGGGSQTDSYFSSPATVMAKAGSNVTNNFSSGASGGSAGSSVGTTKYSGGGGANGSGTSYGGGGGGGAGDAADGGGGVSSAGGTGGSAGGGTGGNGKSSPQGNGSDGGAPGGGGGGALRTSSQTRTGGVGAAGQVKINYVPAAAWGGARYGDFFFPMAGS